MSLIIDPEFKALIPPLTPEERAGLEEMIKAEGCRDALISWHGIIIDGHNRYEICTRNDIEYRIDERDFSGRDDVKVWIIKNQFSRRNLPAYERAKLALVLKPLIATKAKENQIKSGGAVPQISAEPIETRKELAKVAGVSHDTISKVEKIEHKAPEIVKEKLSTGEMSINEAYKEIRKAEKEEQKQIAIESLNKEVLTPTGLYHVLVVDPPWQYDKRAEDATHRGRCLYPTMTISEIMDMEIPAEENSVLWLWTTNAFLHEAYHIIEEWDFTPKTVLTWVKDRMGTGDWLRGKSEHCIMAIRGKPVIDLTNQTTILNAPLREHSRKPDEFYQMVGDLCPGRKIDIFSREPREGWDQWGCESDKF